MFVRARDTDMEIWHGRRAGPEGAVHDYGADEAFTIDEFATELPQLLAGRKQVHYRSEEHTSELQSLMRISYAVFCLKKKKQHTHDAKTTLHISIITHNMR